MVIGSSFSFISFNNTLWSDDEILKASFSDMIAKIAQGGFFPDAPQDPSLAEWSVLQKNTKPWATRLIQLFRLKLAVDKLGEFHLLDSASSVGGKPLTTNWTREHDLHLMIGVYRHGYGNYKAILEDPNLCFAGNFREENAPVPPHNPNAEVWPSVLALGGRFKKLLDSVKLEQKKSRSRAASHAEGADPPAAKKAKTEKQNSSSSGSSSAKMSEEQRLRKLELQRQRRERLKAQKAEQQAVVTTAAPTSIAANSDQLSSQTPAMEAVEESSQST
jgi:hypothetical protein